MMYRALLMKATDPEKETEVRAELEKRKQLSAALVKMKDELREKKIDEVEKLPDEEKSKIIEKHVDTRNKVKDMYIGKHGQLDTAFKSLSLDIANTFSEALALSQRLLPGLKKMHEMATKPKVEKKAPKPVAKEDDLTLADL